MNFIPTSINFSFSIGFAIAKKLGQDGAKVVVSSRKAANVSRAVTELQDLGIPVLGVPCHVAKVGFMNSKLYFKYLK